MAPNTLIAPVGRRLTLIIMPIALAAGIAVGAGGCGGAGGTSATGGVNTACPTQSEGGDTLPDVCAPSVSPSTNGGIAPPVTASAGATPTLPTPACSDPTVTGVLPAQGSASGRDTVMVTGTGFGPGLKVLFGGVPGTPLGDISATEALVETPPGPSGGGAVAVTAGCHGATPSTSGPAVFFSYAHPLATPLTTVSS